MAAGRAGSARATNAVADGFAARGIATLLFYLLTPVEEDDRTNVFDMPLLAARLTDAVAWVRREPGLSGLSLACSGRAPMPPRLSSPRRGSRT
jgi:putative phosphoribosyl transferase